MMAALAAASPPEMSSSGRALHSELFRRDFIGANVALAHFGDAGRARDRDFVQAIQSVDHQGAMQRPAC